jgi:hypothetical protein
MKKNIYLPPIHHSFSFITPAGNSLPNLVVDNFYPFIHSFHWLLFVKQPSKPPPFFIYCSFSMQGRGIIKNWIAKEREEKEDANKQTNFNVLWMEKLKNVLMVAHSALACWTTSSNKQQQQTYSICMQQFNFQQRKKIRSTTSFKK